MNAKLRKWMPIALCCMPGVAGAAVIGIGIAVGGTAFGASLSGPLGLGLIALATGSAVACPVGMGLMMWRGSKQNAGREAGSSPRLADCCAPEATSEAQSSTDRLAALRAQREALERDLAEMQSR